MANWKKGDIITAEALNSGGGAEPSYEVVAEIQVGNPVEDSEGIPEGCVAYMVADTATAKAIMASSGDSLFFNNAETPLTRLDDKMAIFGYNIEMDEVPVVTGNPAYLIAALDEGETDAIVELISTEDLSDTTVRILKQAAEPSVGGKFIVTLTSSEEGGETVYTGDKTIAEIIEANASGMTCVCRISPTTGVTIELPLLTVVPSSEIVLFGCSAYADGAIVYSAYGQTESNVTQWLVHDATLALASDIPSLTGYKKTYEFGFTINSDGQGNWSATADEGTTWAAISTALAETDNVYMIGMMPTGGEIKALFNDITATGAGAAFVHYLTDNVFAAIRLKIEDDDSVDLVLRPLQLAT